MAQVIVAYIDRDNRTRIELTSGGAPVEEDTVTRAVFLFGSYCLDTDEVDDADYIQLSADKTEVYLWLGLVPNLTVGRYTGYLTVYDSTTPNGLAWGPTVTVSAREWNVCEG